MDKYDVIVMPWVSEKSHSQTAVGKYRFSVHPKSNKVEIRSAVEKLFGVKVVAVNTYNLRGRSGTSWTKTRKIRGKGKREKIAVVTLAEGQSIPELSETA